MTNLNFVIDLKIGHWAAVLPPSQLSDTFTHEWEVYVKAADEAIELHKIVDRIIFNLHYTFTDPTRRVKGPQFVLKEQGFGSFWLKIDVVLKKEKGVSRSKEHEHSFDYFLSLPENQSRCSEAKVFPLRIYHTPVDLANVLVNAGIKPLNGSAKELEKLKVKNNKSAKDRKDDDDSGKKSKSQKKDKSKSGSISTQKKLEDSLFSQPIYVTKNSSSSGGAPKVTTSLVSNKQQSTSSSVATISNAPAAQNSSKSVSAASTSSISGSAAPTPAVVVKKEKPPPSSPNDQAAVISDSVKSEAPPPLLSQDAPTSHMQMLQNESSHVAEKEKEKKKKKDKKASSEHKQKRYTSNLPKEDKSSVLSDGSSSSKGTRAMPLANQSNSQSALTEKDDNAVAKTTPGVHKTQNMTSSGQSAFKSDFFKQLENDEPDDDSDLPEPPPQPEATVSLSKARLLPTNSMATKALPPEKASSSVQTTDQTMNEGNAISGFGKIKKSKSKRGNAPAADSSEESNLKKKKKERLLSVHSSSSVASDSSNEKDSDDGEFSSSHSNRKKKARRKRRKCTTTDCAETRESESEKRSSKKSNESKRKGSGSSEEESSPLEEKSIETYAGGGAVELSAVVVGNKHSPSPENVNTRHMPSQKQQPSGTATSEKLFKNTAKKEKDSAKNSQSLMLFEDVTTNPPSMELVGQGKSGVLSNGHSTQNKQAASGSSSSKSAKSSGGKSLSIKGAVAAKKGRAGSKKKRQISRSSSQSSPSSSSSSSSSSSDSSSVEGGEEDASSSSNAEGGEENTEGNLQSQTDVAKQEMESAFEQEQPEQCNSDDGEIPFEDESALSAKDKYNVEYLLKLEELHQIMSDSHDSQKLNKVASILIQSGKAKLCSETRTLSVDLCALQRNTIAELLQTMKEAAALAN